nr:putative transposase [Ipomoea trifida]
MGMNVLARDLSTFRNKSAINLRVHDEQGFLSDEADGPVATLGMTIPHEGSEGPVKRSLLDELSSTKESKKTRESVVKVEKID